MILTKVSLKPLHKISQLKKLRSCNCATCGYLQKLIDEKTRELNNLPAFLDDERSSLEAEIRMYERDMKRIRGGGAVD